MKAFFLSLLLTLATSSWAQTAGSLDGVGTSARFFYPRAIAAAPSGELWVADSSNHSIRHISPEGVVSTIAGLAGQAGSADGLGSAARFYFPRGIALDARGGAWVADSSNHTVRHISASGQVRTVAGLAGQKGQADGVGSHARFNSPNGLALDPQGEVLVADYGNHSIRRISPEGVVTTLAGLAGQAGNADGQGAAARFHSPNGLAVDAAGWVYVADTHNHSIRRISPDGAVTTLAGLAGQAGSADGMGSAARLNAPRGIAIDAQGWLYVADNNNHSIRRVSPQGQVSTWAGLAGQSAYVNAQGAAARLHYPRSVAIDGAGHVYVADTYNHAVRRISPDGRVSTWAGAAPAAQPENPADTAVPASSAWRAPHHVLLDGQGRRYVSDNESGRIYRSTPAGDWQVWVDRSAGLRQPRGMSWDAQGHVLVADSAAQQIFRISPAGKVSVLAGLAGQAGARDGAAAQALFFQPMAVVQAADGRILVADSANHAIRSISPEGQVSTLAGALQQAGAEDGAAASSRWRSPCGLALSPDGKFLYIADSSNQAVRSIDLATGQVRTIAGRLGLEGQQDGTGSEAGLNFPRSLAVDKQGQIWLADSLNHSVRLIDAQTGRVQTAAGLSGHKGKQDGVGDGARFYYPRGITVDAQGQIWLADTLNAQVRLLRYRAGSPLLEVSTIAAP